MKGSPLPLKLNPVKGHSSYSGMQNSKEHVRKTEKIDSSVSITEKQ